MALLEWRGKGFPFKDGRACVGFRVCAESEADAKKALNAMAGWRWFKADDALTPCHGVVPPRPRLTIRWAHGEDLVEVEVPKRAGRLPEPEPSGATRRVQKSVRRLIEGGGHRSTVRWDKESWVNLQFLMSRFDLNQSDTLEKLIRERAAELKRRGER
jgi:hypothetical protein